MDTNQNRKLIAGEVRAARARVNISVLDLATASSISISALRRKLNGETSFTVEELISVACVLGVAVGDFIPDVTATKSA